MTVRMKLRGDKKAMIRFGDQHEEMWFTNFMHSIRDSDPKTHPIISIRDKGGEIPCLPKPKPDVKVDLEKVKGVEKKTNGMKK